MENKAADRHRDGPPNEPGSSTPNGTPSRLLHLAWAPDKDSVKWEQKGPWPWPRIVDWLDLPNPANFRECGGYVGGLLRDGTRRRTHVVSRSLLTLDADKASPTFLDDVVRTLPGVALAVHSTWRHAVEGNRYRLVVPLSRDLSPDEYERLACAVRDTLGDHWGTDKGCPEPERFLFLPSAQNGSYEWRVLDGELLDVERWLLRADELGAARSGADRPEHNDDALVGTESSQDEYLARAVAGELARLDKCELLGWQGPGWDQTTFEVACKLIEFANSKWNSYTVEAAHRDLLEHAPTDLEYDPPFGPREHEEKWQSARNKVGDRGRPHPHGDPADDFQPEEASSGGKRAALAVLLRWHVEAHYDVFPAGDDGRVFAQPKGGGRAELLTGRFVMRAAEKLGDASAGLSTAATEAATVLCARATDNGPRTLALRVHYQPGRIVLDLAQRGNTRCVVVTAEGWTVQDVPPPEVVFQASGAPLSDPVRGGSLDDLRALLRWDSDDPRWLLVKGWLPASLLATVPRPMLGLFGPQGSAKSTTGRFVVGVLDPKPSGVLGGGFGKSRSDDETKALKSYLLAWDNVSSLSSEMADFLSRLVTGDLIERRMLYTDADVVTIHYRRTGLVTGVTVPRGLKPDTLDRFILLALHPVESDRVAEGTLEAEWHQVQPRALAGVLDLAVTMLAGMGEARNPAGLRMADYAEALWAMDKELYEAYVKNVGTARADMAHDDPFIATVLAWLRDEGGSWEGEAEAAREAAEWHRVSGCSWWPRNGKAFSDEVTRTAELLRAVGVTFTERRSNGRRLKKFVLDEEG